VFTRDFFCAGSSAIVRHTMLWRLFDAAPTGRPDLDPEKRGLDFGYNLSRLRGGLSSGRSGNRPLTFQGSSG
jgi:hypothetical protein